MKLFPSKQKSTPKEPKGRPWALSRVLGRSNNSKQKNAPPPIPTTVATRRTTARTKSAAQAAAMKRKNSIQKTQLLADHAKRDTVDRSDWLPHVPFDEILNDHATHNRRSIVPLPAITPTSATAATTPNPKVQRAAVLKSSEDSKKSEGTSSSCTTSLLDDTTLGSFSSENDSTLLDTTTTTTSEQQPQACQLNEGNRDLSLFLCGKILDQAGLRTPQDSEQQKEAWDELILDLLLA